jgi:hypothetical protein
MTVSPEKYIYLTAMSGSMSSASECSGYLTDQVVAAHLSIVLLAEARESMM